MSENYDGTLLNDGKINYLGGRNFISSSKSPVFVVDSGGNKPLADIAIVDVAVLPTNDPNELPYVVAATLLQGNRRNYDTELFPEQFLPYQYLTERSEYFLSDGLSMFGCFDSSID